MSNATTVKQANAEHLADLKRLKPKRQEYLTCLKEQAQRFQSIANKLQEKIDAAARSYVASKETEFEAHIDAELAASDE
jgi:hypothetical protein